NVTCFDYEVMISPLFRWPDLVFHFSEWFYHFSEGGYLDSQYLDILTNSVAQHAMVGTILRAIHLPGIESKNGYRILGYADASSYMDYL
ncbi:hypothetical protein ACTUSQ_24095, partial [Pantoea ananatis]